MKTISSWALRCVLVLLGIINVLIGINVGFGGIQTLGMQGTSKFIEITDQHVFLIQDSHIRYFGGLYIGVGLFLAFAGTRPHKYHSALNLAFFLMFMGGLGRLTMNRYDILFGPELIVSFLAEILLMPILYFWLASVAKTREVL
jgi:Domain of unknown function (DUF4345)